MTNEPYNFSTTATGLMFLSALVGSIFGYFTGVLADTIVVFFARRNNGVKEPEMRLWTLCISFFYAGVGYLLYGWAADAELPWIAIAIGLGAMIAHQVSACSIATAYAMDCFPGVSSKLLTIRTITLLTSLDRSPERSLSSSPSAPRASTLPSRSLCSTLSMPLASGRSLLSTELWSC
jgi:MFS family permease